MITKNETDQFLSELQKPGYALETLVNGNVSECVRYLNLLISHDIKQPSNYSEHRTFILSAFHELNLIKESGDPRYFYILHSLEQYLPKP